MNQFGSSYVQFIYQIIYIDIFFNYYLYNNILTIR